MASTSSSPLKTVSNDAEEADLNSSSSNNLRSMSARPVKLFASNETLASSSSSPQLTQSPLITPNINTRLSASNSPISPKSPKSPNSSATSPSFLPEMPQWKKDLIQRRKTNVARTLGAAGGSGSGGGFGGNGLTPTSSNSSIASSTSAATSPLHSSMIPSDQYHMVKSASDFLNFPEKELSSTFHGKKISTSSSSPINLASSSSLLADTKANQQFSTTPTPIPAASTFTKIKTAVATTTTSQQEGFDQEEEEEDDLDEGEEHTRTGSIATTETKATTSNSRINPIKPAKEFEKEEDKEYIEEEEEDDKVYKKMPVTNLNAFSTSQITSTITSSTSSLLASTSLIKESFSNSNKYNIINNVTGGHYTAKLRNIHDDYDDDNGDHVCEKPLNTITTFKYLSKDSILNSTILTTTTLSASTSTTTLSTSTSTLSTSTISSSSTCNLSQMQSLIKFPTTITYTNANLRTNDDEEIINTTIATATTRTTTLRKSLKEEDNAEQELKGINNKQEEIEKKDKGVADEEEESYVIKKPIPKQRSLSLANPSSSSSLLSLTSSARKCVGLELAAEENPHEPQILKQQQKQHQQHHPIEEEFSLESLKVIKTIPKSSTLTATTMTCLTGFPQQQRETNIQFCESHQSNTNTNTNTNTNINSNNIINKSNTNRSLSGKTLDVDNINTSCCSSSSSNNTSVVNINNKRIQSTITSLQANSQSSSQLHFKNYKERSSSLSSAGIQQNSNQIQTIQSNLLSSCASSSSASAISKISTKLQNNTFIKNQQQNLTTSSSSSGSLNCGKYLKYKNICSNVNEDINNTKLSSSSCSSLSSALINNFNNKNLNLLINNKNKMVAVQDMKKTTATPDSNMNNGNNKFSSSNTNENNHGKSFNDGGNNGIGVSGNGMSVGVGDGNDEDLSFGPGIVSKLRCRYMSLALRESMEKNQNLENMRRATSLSNLLERDDHDHDHDDDDVDDIEDDIEDDIHDHDHENINDDELDGKLDEINIQVNENENNENIEINEADEGSINDLSGTLNMNDDNEVVKVRASILKKSALMTTSTPISHNINKFHNDIMMNYKTSSSSSTSTSPSFVKMNSPQNGGRISGGVGSSYLANNCNKTGNTNNINENITIRSRHFKRGNDSLKRARSVEALLCERSPWQFINNHNNYSKLSSTSSSARCRIGNVSSSSTSSTSSNLTLTKQLKPTCVTIEDKIHNARGRIISGTESHPPKRLTSIIDDAERPPPDLVKQTLKMFEANTNRRRHTPQRGNSKGDVATKVANYKNIIRENKPPLIFPKGPSSGSLQSPTKKMHLPILKPIAKPIVATSADLLNSPIGRKTINSLQSSVAATTNIHSDHDNESFSLSGKQIQNINLNAPTNSSAGGGNVASSPSTPSTSSGGRSVGGIGILSTDTPDIIPKSALSHLITDKGSDLNNKIVNNDSPVTAVTKKLSKLCLDTNVELTPTTTTTTTIYQNNKQQQQQQQSLSAIKHNIMNTTTNTPLATSALADVAPETTTTTAGAAVKSSNNDKQEQQQQLVGGGDAIMPEVKSTLPNTTTATPLKSLQFNDRSSVDGGSFGISIGDGAPATSTTELLNYQENNLATTTTGTIIKSELLNNESMQQKQQQKQQQEQKPKSILTTSSSSDLSDEEDNIDSYDIGELNDTKRITRTALDNIAKAGTTQQFKFASSISSNANQKNYLINNNTTSTSSSSSSSGSIQTNKSDSSSSLNSNQNSSASASEKLNSTNGRQIGVIRPLISNNNLQQQQQQQQSTKKSKEIEKQSEQQQQQQQQQEPNNYIPPLPPTAVASAALLSSSSSSSISGCKSLSQPQAPPLTSREIEKNRINEMKKLNSYLNTNLISDSTLTSSSALPSTSLSSSSSLLSNNSNNITSSLNKVINTNSPLSSSSSSSTSPSCSLLAAGFGELETSSAANSPSSSSTSPSSSANLNQMTVGSTNSPLWALRKKRQTPSAVAENTMVFNFSNRKEVPDYIDNDGVIIRRKRELPKPNESGFVLLGDLSVETSTDNDCDEFSMCPPSPCDVEFENANVVIDGKSSIRQKSKESTFRVQFNDTLTSTFEYPSEASLVVDDSFTNPVDDMDAAFQKLILSDTPTQHNEQQMHHQLADEIIQLPTNNSTSNSPTKNILGNLPLDYPILTKGIMSPPTETQQDQNHQNHHIQHHHDDHHHPDPHQQQLQLQFNPIDSQVDLKNGKEDNLLHAAEKPKLESTKHQKITKGLSNLPPIPPRLYKNPNRPTDLPLKQPLSSLNSKPELLPKPSLHHPVDKSSLEANHRSKMMKPLVPVKRFVTLPPPPKFLMNPSQKPDQVDISTANTTNSNISNLKSSQKPLNPNSFPKTFELASCPNESITLSSCIVTQTCTTSTKYPSASSPLPQSPNTPSSEALSCPSHFSLPTSKSPQNFPPTNPPLTVHLRKTNSLLNRPQYARFLNPDNNPTPPHHTQNTKISNNDAATKSRIAAIKAKFGNSSPTKPAYLRPAELLLDGPPKRSLSFSFGSSINSEVGSERMSRNSVPHIWQNEVKPGLKFEENSESEKPILTFEENSESEKPGLKFEEKSKSQQSGLKFEENSELEKPGLKFEQNSESETPGLKVEGKSKSEKPGLKFEEKLKSEEPSLEFEEKYKSKLEKPGLKFEEKSKSKLGEPGLRFEEKSEPKLEKPGLKFEKKYKAEGPGLKLKEKFKSEKPGLKFEEKSKSEKPGLKFEEKSEPKLEKPGLKFEENSKLEKPGLKFDETCESERPSVKFEEKSKLAKSGLKFEKKSKSQKSGLKFEENSESEKPILKFEEKYRSVKPGLKAQKSDFKFEENSELGKPGLKFEKKYKAEGPGLKLEDIEDKFKAEKPGLKFEEKPKSGKPGLKFEENSDPEKPGLKFEDKSKSDGSQANPLASLSNSFNRISVGEDPRHSFTSPPLRSKSSKIQCKEMASPEGHCKQFPKDELPTSMKATSSNHLRRNQLPTSMKVTCLNHLPTDELPTSMKATLSNQFSKCELPTPMKASSLGIPDTKVLNHPNSLDTRDSTTKSFCRPNSDLIETGNSLCTILPKNQKDMSLSEGNQYQWAKDELPISMKPTSDTKVVHLPNSLDAAADYEAQNRISPLIAKDHKENSLTSSVSLREGPLPTTGSFKDSISPSINPYKFVESSTPTNSPIYSPKPFESKSCSNFVPKSFYSPSVGSPFQFLNKSEKKSNKTALSLSRSATISERITALTTSSEEYPKPPIFNASPELPPPSIERSATISEKDLIATPVLKRPKLFLPQTTTAAPSNQFPEFEMSYRKGNSRLSITDGQKVSEQAPNFQSFGSCDSKSSVANEENEATMLGFEKKTNSFMSSPNPQVLLSPREPDNFPPVSQSSEMINLTPQLAPSSPSTYLSTPQLPSSSGCIPSPKPSTSISFSTSCPNTNPSKTLTPENESFKCCQITDISKPSPVTNILPSNAYLPSLNNVATLCTYKLRTSPPCATRTKSISNTNSYTTGSKTSSANILDNETIISTVTTCEVTSMCTTSTTSFATTNSVTAVSNSTSASYPVLSLSNASSVLLSNRVPGTTLYYV